MLYACRPFGAKGNSVAEIGAWKKSTRQLAADRYSHKGVVVIGAALSMRAW